MKIQIKGELAFDGEDLLIQLSDEECDNDNFVSLTLNETEFHICVTELLVAVAAFDAKRTKRLENESKMI